MRTRALLFALLLSGCGSDPPAAPARITYYVCPDGTTAAAGFSTDRHLLRLGLQGRMLTLTRAADGSAWSNGRLTVTMDDRFLHIDTAGALLTRHCVRQDGHP